MTLEGWKVFHGMTWAEFGAEVDCNPVWARRVAAEGYPCSQELAFRIHSLTGIMPKTGRGRGWSRDDERMEALMNMVRWGWSLSEIWKAMGYKSRASTRAMVSKAKRRMKSCVES